MSSDGPSFEVPVESETPSLSTSSGEDEMTFAQSASRGDCAHIGVGNDESTDDEEATLSEEEELRSRAGEEKRSDALLHPVGPG